MRLIYIATDNEDVWINPEHIVCVMSNGPDDEGIDRYTIALSDAGQISSFTEDQLIPIWDLEDNKLG